MHLFLKKEHVCFHGSAGNAMTFWLGASLYAVGNAIIGASPSAYAIDVLPPEATGLGIGIFRSAGDLGEPSLCNHHCTLLMGGYHDCALR